MGTSCTLSMLTFHHTHYLDGHSRLNTARLKRYLVIIVSYFYFA
ncbi:hypothetical protein QWZ13_02005 [Reinekea marina]|nr:hypothetical protein [Reinekea marina]MDN3647680.1 hypothetical protein [Reinekea marina]